MKTPIKTLLVPNKTDSERNAVVQVWEQAGGKVRAIDRFWEKPDLQSDEKIALYGNDTFVLVLAQVLDLSLLTPEDKLIAEIDKAYTGRNIVIQEIGNLTMDAFPCFVKPVVPKQFRAQVYDSLASLEEQTVGLAESEQIMVSEIISIEAEARAFVLDGEIADLALYEGEADVESARLLVLAFLERYQALLPRVFVLDLAYVSGGGWALMEFNSAWGAGLNGCDPGKVMACIEAATE